MKAGALALVILTTAGCGGELERLARDVHHVQRIMHALDCGDGAPVRLLTDVRCRDGLCGFSCAPDRWLDHPKGQMP